MIAVDTGPFVALFDPRDAHHRHCQEVLEAISEPLFSTVPVLVEAFHVLTPSSPGSRNLRTFVRRGGVEIWRMSEVALERAFELMDQYGDQPMDLADASIISALEDRRTKKVFTLDHRDFSAYRVRRAHRHVGVEIIGR